MTKDLFPIMIITKFPTLPHTVIPATVSFLNAGSSSIVISLNFFFLTFSVTARNFYYFRVKNKSFKRTAFVSKKIETAFSDSISHQSIFVVIILIQ